jgi:hypothetical protein
MAFLAAALGEVADFRRRGLIPDRRVGRDLDLALALAFAAALTGLRANDPARAPAFWAVVCGGIAACLFVRLHAYRRLFRGLKERCPEFLLVGALGAYTLCEMAPLLALFGTGSGFTAAEPFVPRSWSDRRTVWLGVLSSSAFGQVVSVFRAAVTTAEPGRPVPGAVLGMAPVVFLPNLLVSAGIAAWGGRLLRHARRPAEEAASPA